MYENKQNHKKYIGQSINIEKRRWEHWQKPSPYSRFDRILHCLGEEAFTFQILEECPPDQLDRREQYWIEFYHTTTKGYNLTGGGQNYRGWLIHSLN